VNRLTKIIKANLFPDTSAVILAFGYAGGMFTLTENIDPENSDCLPELKSMLYTPVDSILDAFHHLCKIKRNHVYTFKDKAVAYLKEHLGMTDTLAHACVSLFDYRYRIQQQDISAKTKDGIIPREEFIKLVHDSASRYIFTKRYFFLPFRLSNLKTSANKIMIPFSPKHSIELKVKDSFYSKTLAKDYAKTPELCCLYLDTKQQKVMATFGYYFNEPQFETVMDIKQKFYGKVPNLNIFWYKQGKSVGL